MPDVFECGLIGMGPAGIGLAMSLRGTSTIKNMICFERGSFNIDVNCSALSEKECCCSNSCGVISGVGGASTLSSGKISNFPAGSGLAEFFDSEKQLRELLDEVIQFLSDEIQLKRIEIDTATKMNAKAFYKQRNIDYKYYDVYEFDGKSYRSFIQKTVQELMDEGLQLFDNAEVLDVHRDPHTSYFCILDINKTERQLRVLFKDMADPVVIGNTASKKLLIGVFIKNEPYGLRHAKFSLGSKQNKLIDIVTEYFASYFENRVHSRKCITWSNQ